jgi:hypothetical protein
MGSRWGKMELGMRPEYFGFVNDAPVQIADYHAFLVRPLLILATMKVVNDHCCSLFLFTFFNVQIFSWMHTLNVERHFHLSWNKMQWIMINLTEVKWSDFPSFHCYVTIQYAAFKTTCYFRDIYVRNTFVFFLLVLIRFFTWAWDKIGYYGREKYGVNVWWWMVGKVVQRKKTEIRD